MSGFSHDWLSMRESYDIRARNPAVLALVAAQFAQLPSMTIVDLACGTGATRRAIAEQLPKPQHWHLVDNDLGLLARAGSLPSPTGCTTRTMPVDLVRDLEIALDGATDLVTCSALLDLVSEEWLDRLMTECAARRLPLYAAISYDGRISLEPADRIDADIIAAVNEHQGRDKGFGQALGPRATDALAKRCGALGYQLNDGRSDWMLGPEDQSMQRAVLTQWAQAAQEMDAMSTVNIASWLMRRTEHLEAGRSRLSVGHTDLFARPTSMR
jgi:hypothetical protein